MQSADRDWREFVLLLVDIQNDFWNEALAQQFPDFQTNVHELLTFCRTAGMEIVHLRAGFAPNQSDWMARYRLKNSIPCVRGTVGAETLPVAAELAEEKVIVKQTFDGFHNPDLLHHLRGAGKRFVFVAGLLTSVCVFLTAASAAQTGFLTAIVEDCCADQTPMHEHVLKNYSFVFERTSVNLMADCYDDWKSNLREIDPTL